MRTPVRLLVLTTTALLLVGLLATPALAHGRGSDASNYLSVITDAPSLAGITFEVVNSDEYLLLVNDTDGEVAIPGYQGEPYLRVGPDGVFRNRNSQATYVNEDRFGQVSLPPDIDPDGPPDWEQVSTASRYAWHDHRIHWMATAPPPTVQTDPDREQVITTWRVPFTTPDGEHELVGELRWIPGGSPWLWLVPALLLVSIPVAVGLRTRPDLDAGRWPGLSRPAGATLLVIALANVFHLVDDLFATPIPLTESAVAAVQTAFFIGIAVFGAVRAMQAREGAFTALGVAAGAIFIGQGLLYVSVLRASQTASLNPGWLTRAVVAASVAQIVPMGLAAVVGTRRLLPEFDDEELAREAAGAGEIR